MVDTTTRLLARLLDEPSQVSAIRALEPQRFSTLVRSVSLEDAGELLAMATSAQTLAVLDQQLWRSDAGPEEHLDPERFATWLEVLLEGGDARVARTLSEIPEELLTAGLCGQLFVLELDALGHHMAGASWGDAEQAERVLDECLYLEFDRHTLVARHGLGWDPTIAALLALDRSDHALVQRVLERCHHATTDELSDQGEGLHPILRAQQTIEADARADREDRRAREGFVSRASALSFLALAEQTSMDEPSSLAEDAITRAYFREVRPAPGVLEDPRRTDDSSSSSVLGAIIEHLEASEGPVIDARALPAATSSPPEEDSATASLRAAMHALFAADPGRHAQQLARLAYLANVLMAAGRPDGSPYALLEASREALEITAVGFDRDRARAGPGEDWRRLQRIGVDGFFRIGWATSRGPTP